MTTSYPENSKVPINQREEELGLVQLDPLASRRASSALEAPRATSKIADYSSWGKKKTMKATSATSSNQRHRAVLPLNVDGLGLVGRDNETITLKDALARIQTEGASSELVLLEGASGAGKSALVLNFKPHVLEAGGLCGVGKFEEAHVQEQHPDQEVVVARPYSAVVDAITSLCSAVQESEHLVSVREQVDQALGGENYHVLTNLLPSILKLTTPGATESSADEPPSQGDGDKLLLHHHERTTEFAFHRFLDVFRTFLRAVCKVCPVCLFLDDLQWADEASRRLLSSLAHDGRSQRLLLIGATREGKDLGDIFSKSEESDSMLQTAHIQIGALSEHTVNSVVAKLLELRPELTEELSATVFRKTGGNALFVIKYMEMLHSKGWLRFSFKTARWEWDVDEIAASTDVSENVVELLVARIGALPPDSQRALMIAAYLGFRFEGTVLETVLASVDGEMDKSETKTEDEDSSIQGTGETKKVGFLEPAIRAGLIERSAENQYKFSHDQVRKSASALLPDGEEGQRLCARLGEIILELSHSDASEDWMLFSAVDLLCQTSSFAEKDSVSSDLQQTQDLARASLEAAQKAANKSAFISAAAYAENGLQLLSPDKRWKDSYDLCLDLCTLSSRMHYSYGDFEKSNIAACEVLGNAKCLEDKLTAYNVRISIFGSRGDLHGGITESLVVLKQLGVELPPKPTKSQVSRAHRETTQLLGDRRPTDLRDLPTMANNKMVETLRVLHTNTVYAWHAGEANLCIISCLEMMQLTLKHGICQFTPHAVAVYGGMISNFGKLGEAFEFGSLAQELLARPGMVDEAPISWKVIHLFLNHLRKPLHESLDPLLRAYRIGMEIGDVQVASRILTLHATLSVVAGMPIESLVQQIEGYCDFFREYRQHDCLMEIFPWLHLTRNLVGKSDNPLVLKGSAREEAELSALKEDPVLQGDLTIMLHMVSARLFLLCTFGEFDLAMAECGNLKVFENITYSFFLKPFLIFFSGMTFLCLAQKKKFLARATLVRRGRSCVKELQKFVEGGSPNCVPMLKLLQAEQLSLTEKQDSEVTKAYQSAITMAGRSGFRLIKAMACERAGEFLLHSGDIHAATDYLRRSSVEFSEYGARAKVLHMEQKYRQFVSDEISSPFSPARRSSASRSLQPNLSTDWKKKL